MTTTAITQAKPASPATNPAPRGKAIRPRIVGAILGAAALGTFALAAIDTSPSRPAANDPAAAVHQLDWAEVPGGCLSDIECYGGVTPPAPVD